MKRGSLPPLGVHATGLSRPLAASAAKVAMLSWPRFETNTNRPSAVMSISAAVLAPVNVSGTDGITCNPANPPVSAS